MYYIYEGSRYRYANIIINSSFIELYALKPYSFKNRIIGLFVPAFIFALVIENIKKDCCHKIELSDNCYIEQVSTNKVLIFPGNSPFFELFRVNSDTVAKLLSLNGCKGIKYRADMNDKLKASFGHSLNNSQTETSRNQVPDEKVMYVKVKTRSDIPEGAEFDDQTGSKIVYVVMDED